MNKSLSQYTNEVLAELDKTQVPAMLEMAHTLSGTTVEEHGAALALFIRMAFFNEVPALDAAKELEKGIMAAFVSAFSSRQSVN